MKRVLVSLAVLTLWLGCGQQGDLSSATDAGGGGSDSVSLTGSVRVPSTVSKSVVIAPKGSESASESSESGLSLSKSAGASSSESDEGEVQLIVSKATVQSSPDRGTCTIGKLDGTVLDTCLVLDGTLVGANINVNDLDSTKLVEIVCDVGGKKFTKIDDCSNCTNGTTKSTGTTNDTTTVANVLLHTNCDANAHPENKTSSFKSCVSAGEIKSETYKTIEKQLGLTSTVGDDVQGSMAAIKKAIAAGLAEGKITGFAQMAKAVTGDASILAILKAQDSDLSGINLVTAANTAFKGAGGVFNMLKDSTTAAKWSGDAALLALAKTFGKQAQTEAESCITNPANCRALYNKYADDFATGAAANFDKMTRCAKSFGTYMEKFGATAMTTAQAAAAKALYDETNCSAKDASQHDDLGFSIFSQIKGCSTEAQCNDIKDNPTTYGAAIFNDPFALACATCDSIAGSRLTLFAGGGTCTTPCAVDADCSGSNTCSATTHCCVTNASGVGDNSGPPGAPCSADGDCQSDTCTGGLCAGGTFGLKFCSQTCSANADCESASCSSGTCACGGGGGDGGGGGGGGSADGATCTANADCTSTYCGGPSGTRSCKAVGTGALNDVCSAGNQCTTSTCTSNVCAAATVANGETCTANGDCTSTYCGGLSGARECTALAAGLLNYVCSAAGQCSNIHTCTSNVCLRNNGQTCPTPANGDCVSGYCGGPSGTRSCKAVGNGAPNDICTANNQCSHSICSSGTCAASLSWPTRDASESCGSITAVDLALSSTTAGTFTMTTGGGPTETAATLNGSTVNWNAGAACEATITAASINGTCGDPSCVFLFNNP